MDGVIENIKEKALWQIRKFANDADYANNKPFAVEEVDGNLLLTEGAAALWNGLTGLSAITLFDEAHACLGVGDSSTAAAAEQTGLQAAVNKLYKAVDATYPTLSGNEITFRATFSSAEANFAWNEFTVANSNDNTAVNLNRKVSAQGTKIAGQTWELTLKITLS